MSKYYDKHVLYDLCLLVDSAFNPTSRNSSTYSQL